MAYRDASASRSQDEAGRLHGWNCFGEEHRVWPLQIRRRPCRRRGRCGSGKHPVSHIGVPKYALVAANHAVPLQAMLLF